MAGNNQQLNYFLPDYIKIFQISDYTGSVLINALVHIGHH